MRIAQSLAITLSWFLYAVAHADELHVSLGKQEVLIPAGQHGLGFFPDQPICILNERPLTFLLTAGESTFRLSGPSWRTAKHTGKVLQPDAGSFDNGYSGVGGIYRDGDTLYAFYHAEDHEAKASTISDNRGGKPGMFSVALATSQDDGRSFRKVGQVLTSRHPYEPGKECGGIGDITICTDKSNSFLLAYYADFARGHKQGVQICMARSRITDKGMPGTWKKHFQGRLDEPGLAGRESYVVSAFDKRADAYSPCVVYSKDLDRYLMVFCWVAYAETDGISFKRAKESGLYLASSADGVKWDEPNQLFAHSTLLVPGSPGVQHPTLCLTGRKGKSVTGILLYGYTPLWGTKQNGKFVLGTPHHLAGRTITITPKPEQKEEGLEKRLAGTKWRNSNNVSFEWTTDGRLLHNGKEREWTALDNNRVQVVFGPQHKDTLEFDGSLKTFKQLIKGGPNSMEGKRLDTPSR